ncbi:MAG TPA: peptide chain release factor-like protein [Actinoplanes sp.]|nr:peptide chain release factor-like protein [Actinoplanes sp.]
MHDSGPGGQHRNKVGTAILLTHRPTRDRGDRRQHENRRVAWQRLQPVVDTREAGRRHTTRNAERALVFDGGRSFTCTAWRDQVKTYGGARTSMERPCPVVSARCSTADRCPARVESTGFA